MELDEAKVRKTQSLLNSGNKKSPWIPLEGYYTLTKIDIDSKGATTFNPTTGLPLKTFVNTDTGEIKIFHINALKGHDVQVS